MTAPTARTPPPAVPGVGRSLGATLGSSLVLVMLLAVANVIVSRLLGVEGRGVLAAATLIPMIVGYAGELGIPVACGYLINARAEHRGRIIASARGLALVVSIALFAVSAALSLLLPLPGAARGLSIGFSVFVILNLLYRVNLAVLQADLRLRLFNGIRVAGAFLYVAILLTYAVVGIHTELPMVVALLIMNGVWCAWSWGAVGTSPTPSIDRHTSGALLHYGIRAHLGNVAVVDALRVDQLVLALLLEPTQLGLYVAAMTVITANRVIGTSVGVLCFPLATKGDRGRDAAARRQFHKLVTVTAALSALVAVGEFALGGRLLSAFFGAEFAGGGRALQLLAVASVSMNLRQVYADWLRGCGKPGSVAYAELVSVATLALFSILLWDGSVVAVAWAVSASSVASLVCLMVIGVATNKEGAPAATDPDHAAETLH